MKNLTLLALGLSFLCYGSAMAEKAGLWYFCKKDSDCKMSGTYCVKNIFDDNKVCRHKCDASYPCDRPGEGCYEDMCHQRKSCTTNADCGGSMCFTADGYCAFPNEQR